MKSVLFIISLMFVSLFASAQQANVVQYESEDCYGDIFRIELDMETDDVNIYMESGTHFLAERIEGFKAVRNENKDIEIQDRRGRVIEVLTRTKCGFYGLVSGMDYDYTFWANHLNPVF